MRKAAVNYSFLLVGERAETQWPVVLQQALSPIGKLRVVSEEEAVSAIIESDYDAILVDAGSISDAASLTSRLRTQRPEAHVIIFTASPTWKRARQALKAGASDYMHRSLNKEELRSTVQAVLKVPPPPLAR